MPLPLPVLTLDELLARRTSARRAADLVAEAGEKRFATWAADIRRVDQEWRDRGFADGAWCAADELSLESAFLQARNCFLQLPLPRIAKMHRARLRRYQRLRYQYEQQHPPFKPFDRRTLYDSQTTNWSTHVPPETESEDERQRQLLHELQHPPFAHPDFPEHPSLAMWREGIHNDWGYTGNWTGFQAITEANDCPSPVHIAMPLPFPPVPY
ncbi:hypothetical protein K438DRAFT_1995099 [Mycena galopus ATCC 62051]|nr:hypothetical protein K438DRAFT_1995099 [Mycena galopus ATCC 62051]